MKKLFLFSENAVISYQDKRIRIETHGFALGLTEGTEVNMKQFGVDERCFYYEGVDYPGTSNEVANVSISSLCCGER